MNEQERENRTAVAGQQTEVAVLAGGCFWGVEEILRAVPGVLDTDVGYTGGWLPNPTYDDTHDSKSGHAEAIRVTFDPSVLSYEDLLEQWFFRLHDPTTLNRQGNDVGTQYRSAIFPQTPEQREAAERVKARVEASGKWKRPVTTSIEPAGTWYSAEGVSPGLSAEASRRLQLPLHARLDGRGGSGGVSSRAKRGIFLNGVRCPSRRSLAALGMTDTDSVSYRFPSRSPTAASSARTLSTYGTREASGSTRIRR